MQLGGLGERCKLPVGLGGARRQTILVHFELKKAGFCNIEYYRVCTYPTYFVCLRRCEPC